MINECKIFEKINEAQIFLHNIYNIISNHSSNRNYSDRHLKSTKNKINVKIIRYVSCSVCFVSNELEKTWPQKATTKQHVVWLQ